jgi:hypothetical protein
MKKYQVIMEIWRAEGIFDPSKEEFFEWGCSDPSGVYAEEVVATFDTKEEALAELAKHKCTYEKWENYNETKFELYAVQELIYDEGGDIEDYGFIQYADVEI